MAEGDTPSDILARFGLQMARQLVSEDGQIIGTNLPIYPDDRLTLTPNATT